MFWGHTLYLKVGNCLSSIGAKMKITKILLETSQRTRIRSMIDMCHADEHRRVGETFQAEILVQRL